MTKHVADCSFLGELCLCRGLSGPRLTQISPLSSKEISECELRARWKPSLERWFGGKFKSCSFCRGSKSKDYILVLEKQLDQDTWRSIAAVLTRQRGTKEKHKPNLYRQDQERSDRRHYARSHAYHLQVLFPTIFIDIERKRIQCKFASC